MLRQLREAGADRQVATQLDRDPAAHVSLDNPNRVASLLDVLRKAGADRQVATLLDRDAAALVSLENPDAVDGLLRALHEVGNKAQVAELIERLPASGRFDLFCATTPGRRTVSTAIGTCAIPNRAWS